jgi:superfamily I DNA/RNA helicase
MWDGLNEQQAKAVQTVDGRVLILAGAGSGKTSVLTLRMAHLIKNLGVSPKAILGLTFTNKAATEMRHRLAQLIDATAAKQATLSTFHSFCMQILRQDIHRLGYTQQFTLYDEKDVHRLVSLIARDLLDREGDLPSLTATIALIVNAKNKGLKPEELFDSTSPWHEQFARTVYTRLKDSMRAYNAVDFDNLLCLSVELFEKHPDVLEKYQERYRYIMIDEYQDTNPIQYRLAELLSFKYQNLCVVGDDDQSIYGWRGAEVRNILEFENQTLIKLEQNYRSTNSILKAANAVIGHNHQRHAKVLWSSRGEGVPIEVFHAPSEIEEAQAVAARMAKLHHEQKIPWRNMAILYRSNALSRQLEIALMKQPWREGDEWHVGIPFQVFGGVEFYERREVKDVFAYLRLIVNPKDQEALLRIINQPRRGIGDAALDHLTAYNRLHNLPLWQVIKGVCDQDSSCIEVRQALSAKTLQALQTFISLIEEGAKSFEVLPLDEALRRLIVSVDYEKAVRDEVKSPQMRAFKWDNVQEFVSTISEFSEHWQREHETYPTLHDFVTGHPLQNDWEGAARQKKAGGDCVNLMTLHSSKGLEFKVCFVVGLEDHIIPHEKSLKETGLEEERRLMYVGITRAMEKLILSMACRRKRNGIDHVSRPSRFLYDIPQELLKSVKWGDL